MNKYTVSKLLVAAIVLGFTARNSAFQVLNTLGNEMGLESCFVKQSEEGDLKVVCMVSGEVTKVIEPVHAKQVGAITPPWTLFTNYIGQTRLPCPPCNGKKPMAGSPNRTIYCHGTSCIPKPLGDHYTY